MIPAPHPSLVEQAYEAIFGEIADGTLAPSTHLIQEELATRYGVSRQPIQQALLLLKNDGIVQDGGRRGLIVAPLDKQMMRDRYEIRAALDALAARLAARRCAASPETAMQTRTDGERRIGVGLQAVAGASIKAMIAHDVAFHGFVYSASGNPVNAALPRSTGAFCAVWWARFCAAPSRRRTSGSSIARSSTRSSPAARRQPRNASSATLGMQSVASPRRATN